MIDMIFELIQITTLGSVLSLTVFLLIVVVICVLGDI